MANCSSPCCSTGHVLQFKCPLEHRLKTNLPRIKKNSTKAFKIQPAISGRLTTVYTVRTSSLSRLNNIRHSSSVWKKFLISGITSVPGYNFPQRWWTTLKNRISSGQGKMRPPAPPILDPMCKCGHNLKLWNRSTHPERSGSGPPLVFTLGLNPSVTRIGRRKRRADHWQN